MSLPSSSLSLASSPCQNTGLRSYLTAKSRASPLRTSSLATGGRRAEEREGMEVPAGSWLALRRAGESPIGTNKTKVHGKLTPHMRKLQAASQLVESSSLHYAFPNGLLAHASAAPVSSPASRHLQLRLHPMHSGERKQRTQTHAHPFIVASRFASSRSLREHLFPRDCATSRAINLHALSPSPPPRTRSRRRHLPKEMLSNHSAQCPTVTTRPRLSRASVLISHVTVRSALTCRPVFLLYACHSTATSFLPPRK